MAMMTKWIVKALEPGTSNLQLLLKYRLERYQPYSGDRWGPNMDYFTKLSHQYKQGSKVWNRMAETWKTMNKDLVTTLLITYELQLLVVLGDFDYWTKILQIPSSCSLLR